MGIRRRAAVRHPVERNVGTCGTCMGAMLYNPETKEATCPCGITRIPRQFLLVNERMAR